MTSGQETRNPKPKEVIVFMFGNIIMCGTQMRDRVVQQSSTDPTASRALLNKMLSTDSLS
jgi:hypothetical protein